MRRFGRYTLVKKLATGGMAEIWLARQRGLAGFNRFVVIKKILSHLSEQETFVKMFLDEARTSAQLNHPNVVQIYDLGREGESYYIAMEFIAGENLAAIAWRGMKRGRPLSPQFAARIIADTCKALHYAHHLRGSDGQALEIVHRDISPQNILVTYEGEVKVVDFGIAKAATKSEHTKTGMLKGKFSYMSPEQCLGTPVDMRSDIFALGILLYELCTGKRLFKHESELMILEMITKRTVVPPSQVAPGISPRLEEVIMTALEKPVERRFQTAQDMQIALEEYLREEQRAASNADIASYMRALFEDKIEEKRLLREAASRDDFESAFTDDDEETEQAMNARGQGGRRRVVHGLPPSQVRVGPAAPGITGASMPQFQRSVTANFPAGSMPPGMLPPGVTPNGMIPMAPGQTPMGYMTPYGQAGAPMAPGMSYSGAAISYGGAQMPQQPEASSWIARLVIIGALVVILVASAILYQQLMRNDPAQTAVVAPPVAPAVPPKTGKLVLDSSPTGAAIYLDGKPMMLDNGDHARTPSDLTSLQYGTTYNIRLVKEGHDLFEQSIVMDATTDGKTIRPKLKPRPGKLIVEVTGPNARDVRVFLGNEDVGLGPMITKELDAFENVVISAKLTGMACTAEPPRVRISPDATQRSTVRCEVARAGRNTDRPAQGAGDPGGTTTRRNTTKTTQSGGDATKVAAATGCAPIPSLPPGYVTISTNPFSDIYIGGKRVGETPLARHKLPSGCVEVKAVTKDGKSVTQQLTVEPNKVMIYKFDVK
ncbi:protein kinase [Myxococcota bacterium]|nr:protein kinase [Myxococcota bacterium]